MNLPESIEIDVDGETIVLSKDEMITAITNYAAGKLLGM